MPYHYLPAEQRLLQPGPVGVITRITSIKYFYATKNPISCAPSGAGGWPSVYEHEYMQQQGSSTVPWPPSPALDPGPARVRGNYEMQLILHHPVQWRCDVLILKAIRRL